MILNLVADALAMKSEPGSPYYRHPEWTNRFWWWEFNRISYLGGREYQRPARITIEFDYPLLPGRDANGMPARDAEGRLVAPSTAVTGYASMLFRHNREQSWEFENRRRRAHYHNIVGTSVNMLVSNALKKGVDRKGDEKFTEFWKGVDCQRTQDIDSFMREGLRWAEVFGIMWCFADVATAEQKRATPKVGDLPYVYWVSPLDIFDWHVDGDGNFVWLKQFVYAERERKPNEEVQPIHRFRTWYKDRVEEIDVDPKTQAKTAPVVTAHVFGRIPAEPLYAKRRSDSAFPDGESLTSDLSKAANAVYNYRSLLDEILYKQTFSQLLIPDTSVDAVQIGTSTVLTYNPLKSSEAKYISADPEQARVCMEAIVGELEQARQAFGIGRGRQEGSMQRSSGQALELESETMRSMLADVASSGSDFEQRLVNLLDSMRSAGAASADTKTSIKYPTEFDVQAFADDIKDTLSLQAVGMSPQIMLAIKRQLAARRLAGMDEETKQDLLDTLKETDPVAGPLGGAGGGPPGATGGAPAGPGQRDPRSAQPAQASPDGTETS